ncbi:MAG: polysaccharide deacetylase family protein [Candidatus Lokiarchaeota archaeon]|nr:polysaccharide deacetylase family protein [Candidatus Lokiarchaeota archaeon]
MTFVEKIVCYTLDLEEDHAGYLKNKYEGLNYLEEFLDIINKKNIFVSFFVQAKLFEMYPEKIELIKEYGHDIHLHSYNHEIQKFNTCYNEKYHEILKSKQIFSNFFNKNPIGYRFPLGIIQKSDYKLLDELDFEFDSSIFPNFRIGYFNNLNKPITPYFCNRILEIPFSPISNHIRIPVSLSYIKLFYPLHFLLNYKISPLIFNIHLHDLFRLSSTQRLSFFKRLPYLKSSENGLAIFLKFVDKLSKLGYNSKRIIEIYEEAKKKH